MHERDADTRTRYLELLRDYIYFQCAPKILSRLELPVDRRTDEIYKVLLDVNVRDIGKETVSRNDNLIPDKINERDEFWLHNELPETLSSDMEFMAVEVAGKTLKRLEPTPQGLRALWKTLRGTVGTVKKHLTTALSHADGGNVTNLRTALERLDSAMRFLVLLAHHCPTLWHLFRDPAVARVSYQIAEVQTGLGGASLQQPMGGAGDQGTSAPGPPLYADTEEAEVGDVDDIDGVSGQAAPMSRTSDQVLGHWVKCLCHWTFAIQELQRYFPDTQKPRTISIKTISAQPTAHAQTQASLQQTIAGLNLSAEGGKKAWAALKEVASRRHAPRKANPVLKPGRPPSGSKSQRRWAALYAGQHDNDWENLFSGRVHCETLLAALMLGTVVDRNHGHTVLLAKSALGIGVSKRCCYLCDKFLDYIEGEISTSGSDGRIYAWTPPYVDVALLKALVNNLRPKLKHFLLNTRVNGTGVEDSASGSDSTDLFDTKLEPSDRATIQEEIVGAMGNDSDTEQ